MTPPPRVFAADLSITATGWADAYDGRVWTGTITTKSGTGTHSEKSARMATVTQGLRRLVDDGPAPALVLVEGPSYGSKGNAMFDLGGLWWRVYEGLAALAPVVVVTPSQRMLYATGKGQAKKDAVVDAFARRWPDIDTGVDNNRIDAAVLALMGLEFLGRAPVAVPKSHRAALDKVAWPRLGEFARKAGRVTV